ncbi:MAG: dihydroxyacetone kinase subunit DhaL [Nitrososphaeria archaeon]|nr:dihydroxyacetone kinase subunit DhaL [Conexivisphaerales archaeon]
MSFNVEFFRCFLLNASKEIQKSESELTDLDSKIGDSDFGINISRGFRALEKDLKSEEIGKLLDEAGKTIMEEASGTFGTLLGSMLVAMGKASRGKKEVDVQEMKKMFEEGIKVVEELGGAKRGQKTFLDVLYPFTEKLNQKDSAKKVIEEAIKAAEEGMTSTKDMIATVGRASYYGERSRGHLDPGAVAMYIILKSMEKCI